MSITPASSSAFRLLTRMFLGLIRWLAALRLAVVLIALYAGVIAWTSFLESSYGASAVHFAVYEARWFLGLNILLALNVLFAALVRFPWRRGQLGFVITHAGILTLMAGCLMSWRGGIEARLPVIEGRLSNRAYQNSQRIVLQIAPNNIASGEKGEDALQTVQIPFFSGPFNWDDYQTKLSWFPWRLAQRSQGILYDYNGVRLEVLNYYSRCRQFPIPRIVLQVEPALHIDIDDQQPMRLELAVAASGDLHLSDRPAGIGDRIKFPGGQRILFWLTACAAETEAFLHSAPQQPMDPSGEVALYANGKSYRLTVKELQDKLRHALGDTGLEVELIGLNPQTMGMRIPGVELRIHKPEAAPQSLTLYASLPAFNRQDYKNGVFGTYWFSATAEYAGEDENQSSREALLDARAPRLDIILGQDGKLYYRAWQSSRLTAIGPWPNMQSGKGSPDAGITVFENTSAAIRVHLESLISSAKPDWRLYPLPFDKHQEKAEENAVQLRLTVDDTSEEFWLVGATEGSSKGLSRRVIESQAHRVTVTMQQDAVDLGFAVYLQKFQTKLDPGSGMSSHYSSLVDFVQRDPPHRVLQKNVLITLNAPVDFTDPKSGRAWRLFQSSFDGPWKPGSPQFQSLAGEDRSRDQISLSVLTISSDPGRALKYTGSLLIIVGIALVYYLRKYAINE